jgi:alkylation response protein AidB-like acyl-CoA dehydrogenase
MVDFSLNPGQREFQAQLCAFLDDPELASELENLRRFQPGNPPDPSKLYRRLGERGWLAPNWPVAYGGAGLGLIEAAILADELCGRGVVDTMRVVTVDFVGLFLLLAGSETQKDRFLPPIAAGECYVCTMHSEPSVGSDLGGISTRAVPVDGGYALTGTKLYSLRTELCEYGLCTARLDDGRGNGSGPDGLTVFMVPLRAPGVRVVTVPGLADEPFGRVELEGAFVAEDHVIGRVGDGWRLVNASLAIERTGLEQASKCRYWLDRVLARAHDTGALTDPRYAARFATLDAEVEAGRLLAWQLIADLEVGRLDAVGAAMSKWFNSELARRIAALARECDGMDALSAADDAVDGGFVEWLHREAPGMTISAGTAEIMLYVVAGAEVSAA